MMTKQVRYRGGYKYQLEKDLQLQVSIKPLAPVSVSGFIDLNSEGRLSIYRKYAWEGPSGPSVDTVNFMRGALVHDALYQLMREAGLSKEEWRRKADLELKRMCLQDGMSRARAWWVYWSGSVWTQSMTQSGQVSTWKPSLLAASARFRSRHTKATLAGSAPLRTLAAPSCNASAARSG